MGEVGGDGEGRSRGYMLAVLSCSPGQVRDGSTHSTPHTASLQQQADSPVPDQEPFKG